MIEDQEKKITNAQQQQNDDAMQCNKVIRWWNIMDSLVLRFYFSIVDWLEVYNLNVHRIYVSMFCKFFILLPCHDENAENVCARI